MTVILTAILGVIYPLIVLGSAQVLFNHQANGSLILRNGSVVGSSLIGQEFTLPKYFWSRLSATAPAPYDAAASGGTNLGPTSRLLLNRTVAEAALIRKANGLPANYVLPSDAVSASASGLDPDISPAYAEIQVRRISRVRHLSVSVVRRIVAENTSGRTFGLLGEPRMNVLDANLALDALSRQRAGRGR
jgi:K+-transporting ATPase ATPase C chain